jgi:hypothetical protein
MKNTIFLEEYSITILLMSLINSKPWAFFIERNEEISILQQARNLTVSIA